MNMNAAKEEFIEIWGSLGALWGINRSMARVHALLLVSEEPLDLDAISDSLNISRGNASMTLKDLRSWGVIHRIHVSGDRRDFYVAEQDSWTMLSRIAAERKKREFDPAYKALQSLLGQEKEAGGKKSTERLRQLESILRVVQTLLERYLANEKKSRAVFDFISGTLLGKND